jgi:hypothetical protein
MTYYKTFSAVSIPCFMSRVEGKIAIFSEICIIIYGKEDSTYGVCKIPRERISYIDLWLSDE